MQRDQLPPLNKGYEDNLVLSDDIFDVLNGEGEDSSDFDKKEESRDEDMVDQDLDWMAQGPLSLSNNLHKMPKHPKMFL